MNSDERRLLSLSMAEIITVTRVFSFLLSIQMVVLIRATTAALVRLSMVRGDAAVGMGGRGLPVTLRWKWSAMEAWTRTEVTLSHIFTSKFT